MVLPVEQLRPIEHLVISPLGLTEHRLVHQIAIDPENLYIYYLLKTKYKTTKATVVGGKKVEVSEIDFEGALEDKFIAPSFKGSNAKKKLKKFYNDTRERIMETTLMVLDPSCEDGDYPYVSSRAFFPKEDGFEELDIEIRARILRGEMLDKIKRDLYKPHSQPAKRIENLWRKAKNHYDALNPEELAYERMLVELLIEAEIIEHKPKPGIPNLPPYSEEEVEAAHREAVISDREAKILMQHFG